MAESTKDVYRERIQAKPAHIVPEMRRLKLIGPEAPAQIKREMT